MAISACTTVPQKMACQDLGFCNESPTAHKKNRGLDAKFTVQRMLNAPMLINGKPANAADWPASVYATAGNAACSATLVGERVVIMASHCMDDGGQISFSAHANNYTATCTHHPAYTSNITADWALCLVDRPVTGVAFENLGVNVTMAIGETVLLSGYGCITAGGGGGNDGIFRVGDAVVQGLPVSASNSNDTVTQGGAALCFGDSGGAAYKNNADGSRSIFAINSRGNIATTSYLASVYTGQFATWAKTWATNSANVKMCGVHSDALYCRTNSTHPPADNKFQVSSGAACINGVVGSDYLEKKDAIIQSIQNAIENF